MNVKRYIIATIALFIFIVLYEWFVHGFLLMGIYEETSEVWRSFQEMASNLPLALCFQFVLSAWTAFVFTQIYKDGGWRKGLLFGLFFGVFAGILSASWYIWLPVSVHLGWAWFFGAIGEGLGGGIILGSIYKRVKN